MCVDIVGIVGVLARCSNVIEKRIHVRHDQVISRGKLALIEHKCKIIIDRWPTLMQRAKHLAAADSGGGALLSEANPYSKSGRGEVTKRRNCPIIFCAIAGKLDTGVRYRIY